MTKTPQTTNPSTEARGRLRVLCLSTAAFTLLFNVWLMLGVLGIPIRKALDLSDSQLEWLIATAILSGAVLRLNFGIWADKYGGRNVMVLLLLLAAIPTYLFSRAANYTELLICAGLFGLAGNAFSVGIAWNSAWFPSQTKGTALGIFGAGNVGAVGTKLLVLFVPTILTLVPAGGYLGGWFPGGWRAVPALYSACLLLMAGLIVWLAPASDPRPVQGRALSDIIAPLRFIRVWRFSLYYVVVFAPMSPCRAGCRSSTSITMGSRCTRRRCTRRPSFYPQVCCGPWEAGSRISMVRAWSPTRSLSE